MPKNKNEVTVRLYRPKSKSVSKSGVYHWKWTTKVWRKGDAIALTLTADHDFGFDGECGTLRSSFKVIDQWMEVRTDLDCDDKETKTVKLWYHVKVDVTASDDAWVYERLDIQPTFLIHRKVDNG